jgi:hypothetical protein
MSVFSRETTSFDGERLYIALLEGVSRRSRGSDVSEGITMRDEDK